MFNVKDIITGEELNPYKYLATPLFNIPGLNTHHNLVLIAVGIDNDKETYKSETCIENSLLQSCVEGVEEAAKYIINQKVYEFKEYLAMNGKQNYFELTVYLNNEIIDILSVDSCYI